MTVTALRTVCLLLLFAPVAAAQTTDRTETRRRLIERFDTDGDGRLSAAERQRAKTLLQELSRGKNEAGFPQTIFPGKTDLYKVESGPHRADVIDSFLLHDDKRNKDIPLRITFPQKPGSYPLIIFCHGALGSKDNYQPLVKHWVSHGYIVIQPTFDDSVSLMTEEEKQNVKSIVALVNSSRVNKAWDQRPQDVRHVIDSLDLIEKKLPKAAGRIDRSRIAVGGHSYGAHTSMLIAGMKLRHRLVRKSPNFRDDRVRATIMISPQGTGSTINTDSYQSMQGPILMITGDNDGSPRRGQENQTGEWRREAFDQCPPGDDKYLLWINEASHGFGGISGSKPFPSSGPVAPDHVILIQSTVLAFCDAYLHDDAAAKAYLGQADQLNHRSGGKASLTIRGE